MAQKLFLHFQMGSGDVHDMFRFIIVLIIHLDTLAMGGDISHHSLTFAHLVPTNLGDSKHRDIDYVIGTKIPNQA